MVRKGEIYFCKKSVVMDDGRVSYVSGHFYASEKHGCLTDEEGDENHSWLNLPRDFNEHFKLHNQAEDINAQRIFEVAKDLLVSTYGPDVEKTSSKRADLISLSDKERIKWSLSLAEIFVKEFNRKYVK